MQCIQHAVSSGKQSARNRLSFLRESSPKSLTNQPNCGGPVVLATAVALFLPADSLVAHHPDAVAREVGDGIAVVLNLGSGVYYRLDRFAVRIWNLLAEQPVRFGEVVHTIAGEGNVEPERCERDLSVFMHELLVAGLVEIDGGESEQPPLSNRGTPLT